MRFISKTIIFLLFLIILVGSSAAAFELIINEKETVEAAEIYLGEIAVIKGAELSSEKLNQLKELRLTASPQPGYQKLINRVLVELSIENLGFNKNEFKVKMPKKVIIERKSSFIENSTIRNFVEKKIKEEFQIEADKIVFKELNNPERYYTAAGDYKLALASQSSFKFGRNNIALEIFLKENLEKRIYYRFELGLKTKIFRALKDLAYNSALKRSDFEVVEKTIYQNPSQLIKSWDDVKNKELRTTLKKGDSLLYKKLKNPYLVQWGDRLKVTIVKNNVVLSSFVTARGRGKMGDEITVENENSGYRFQAEVISKNEVKYISP